MDIKFFLILAIILLVTMYFINEFKMLRTYILETSENNTKLIKSKYNSIVTDIKDINFDLLNQTKKINKIHSQKITTMSNYFTESETDGNNLLNYLSDAKSNKKNVTSTDNNFKINFNTDKNYDKNCDNNILEQQVQEQEVQEQEVQEQGVPEHINTEKSNNQLNKTNDQDLISVSDNNNNEDDIDDINLNNVQDNVEVEDLLNQNGRLDLQQNDSNTDGSGALELCEPKSTIIIETNEENNQKSTTSRNDSPHEILNNNVQEQKKEDESTKISITNKDLKSLHDAISFGSKKKGKNIVLEAKQDRDVDSLITTEILKINKLNPMETYNLKQLQKIATILTIPTKYKDGKKNITYKKEELYLKIKDELNKKSI